MSIFSHQLRKVNKDTFYKENANIEPQVKNTINESKYNWYNITPNSILNEDVEANEFEIKFKILNDFMRYYENNFRIMHWNAAGEEFNDTHKSITEQYYDMLAECIDKVSEIMGIFNIFPDSLEEVISRINATSSDMVVNVDPNKYYTRAEVISLTNKMFSDICKILAAIISDPKMEDPINAGAKSELEDILYKFTFELNYINKRRAIQ